MSLRKFRELDAQARLTMGWGLLIPKGWSGLLAISAVAWGLLSTIRLQDTVTVGSILITAVVIIAAGVFTFRNNMRTFWRNLAEERAEQIKVLEQHAHDKETRMLQIQETARVQLITNADEQRVIRHELKNQLAAAQAQLAVEHAKTDLSPLMELLTKQHDDAMKRMEDGLERQARMLEILEATTAPTEGEQ